MGSYSSKWTGKQIDDAIDLVMGDYSPVVTGITNNIVVVGNNGSGIKDSQMPLEDVQLFMDTTPQVLANKLDKITGTTGNIVVLGATEGTVADSGTSLADIEAALGKAVQKANSLSPGVNKYMIPRLDENDQISGGWKFYQSISEVDSTFDNDLEVLTLVDAMPNQSFLICSTYLSSSINYANLRPSMAGYEYGILRIIKINNNRTSLEYIAQNSSSCGMWVGETQQQGSSLIWSGWKNLITSANQVEALKYNSDIIRKSTTYTYNDNPTPTVSLGFSVTGTDDISISNFKVFIGNGFNYLQLSLAAKQDDPSSQTVTYGSVRLINRLVANERRWAFEPNFNGRIDLGYHGTNSAWGNLYMKSTDNLDINFQNLVNWARQQGYNNNTTYNPPV